MENSKNWNEVSGYCRVFGKTVKYKRKGKEKAFIACSTSIGLKDEETGDYSNQYYKVAFPKDSDPAIEGTFSITIKKGFITFEEYTDKDGNNIKAPKIFVQAYSDFTNLNSRDE